MKNHGPWIILRIGLMLTMSFTINSMAAIYTYTPTGSSTDQWASGTNWSATPVSSSTTELTFVGNNATVLAVFINTDTNNIGPPFVLNILDLQGTGPLLGLATINIAGNQLSFTSNGATTPVINLTALSGLSGLTYNINTALALTNTTTFTGNGTATFNFNGVISGSGSLTKSGTSTLRLLGANTNTGGDIINAGTVLLGGSGTLGANGNALTVNGGTVDLNGTSQSVGNLSGTGGTIVNNAGLSSVILTIGAGNGTGGNYAGVIANGALGLGVMGLTKTGTGLITLSGINTMTGVVTLNDGTLSVATIGNGSIAGNLGQASSAASNLVFNGGALRYTGATATTNRSFTIQPGKTATFDITANNLTVSGASTSTTGALTKTGVGTLTLSGSNGYTGTTTVSQGTLVLNASNTIQSATASMIAITAGGTLLTFANNAVNNPNMAVRLSGSTTGGAPATFSMQGSSNTSETVGALTMIGSTVINFGTGSGDTLNFSSLTPGSLSTGNTLAVYNWTGLPYTTTMDNGSIGDTQDRLLFTNDPQLTAAQSGQISFYSDSGTTFLGYGMEVRFGNKFEFVPTPEPSTIIVGLGLLGLLARRLIITRRRSRPPAC